MCYALNNKSTLFHEETNSDKLKDCQTVYVIKVLSYSNIDVYYVQIKKFTFLIFFTAFFLKKLAPIILAQVYTAFYYACWVSFVLNVIEGQGIISSMNEKLLFYISMLFALTQ